MQQVFIQLAFSVLFSLQPTQEEFHQRANLTLPLRSPNWCCRHEVQVGVGVMPTGVGECAQVVLPARGQGEQEGQLWAFAVSEHSTTPSVMPWQGRHQPAFT